MKLYSNKVLLLAVFFLCLVVLSSCSLFPKKINKKDYPELMNPYFTSVFGNYESHIFRGFDLGNKKETIKKKETKAKLVDEDETRLFYEIDFPKDSTLFIEYADMQYYFNGSELDMIEVNYYMQDSSLIENAMKSINSALTILYGESHEDEYGYTVWVGDLKDGEQEGRFDIGVKRLFQISEPGITIEIAKLQ